MGGMRVRAITLLLALAACDDAREEDPGFGGGAEPAPDGPGCTGVDLIASISVDGDPIPGREVTLSAVDAGSGRAYDVTWSVPSGTLSATTGASVTWTLDDDVAVHVAETLTVEAQASAPGCDDDAATLDVIVNWPDHLRAVVIYDPGVTGSQEVAEAYADFRDIPAENLCAATATDTTTIAAAEFAGWLAQVTGCVDAIGEHVQYLAPVWGVPYKVSGQVDDLGSGNPTTVSLDALLVFGHRGDDIFAALNNPLYQPGDSPTATYADWVPIGELRAEIESQYYDRYYLVARIDGADASAAMDLVDRTAAAEALARMGMLDGTVYVDGNRGLPHPPEGGFGSYEWGEWNIIGVENVFTALGWYDVVVDYNNAEFGTAPAPLTCPDALYYAGWYSFGNYNDVFTWNVGAIGGHLDSCSACNIRSGGDWSAVALQRGITATFGAVNEPYVAGMPEYDQFFKYLTDGASYGEAAYSSTVVAAWMMVWVGDPLYRPYPAK
jgi:uncharacterized protein (TIGR03790 family)